MRKFYVYKHTCPNGKVYIGITSQNPTSRWNGGTGYRKNRHFYRAIKKYGWDNVVHEILFSGLSEDEAKEKEIDLIALYRSTDAKYGYNRTKGGDTRLKMTPEQIEIMRKRLTGKKRTEEQRQHYREAARKRPKRLRLTEEHKRKISQSLIGNKFALGKHSNGKRVLQYTTDGVFVTDYISVKVAARSVGLDNSGISRCCRENMSDDISKTKYKGRYGGFKWIYA